MKGRPACAVATCAALATPRRVVCAVHAAAAAFVVVSLDDDLALGACVSSDGTLAGPAEWRCRRCAAARVREAVGRVLLLADAEAIAARNRGAATRAGRASCADCGALLPSRRGARRPAAVRPMSSPLFFWGGGVKER